MESLYCISIYQGNGHVLRLTVTKKGGGTLTLAKAWFTVKADLDQADTDALVALNTADHPTKMEFEDNGTESPKVKVTLASADTKEFPAATYKYDFRVQVSGQTDVQTVDPPGVSTFTVKAAVTQATT